MRGLFSVIFFFSLFWGSFSFADLADDLGLKCVAKLDLPGESKTKRVTMKRASYDPQYFEAEIDDFGFGADTYFLESGGVGLIIYNHPTKDFSSATVGFRQVPNSQIYTTNLSHRESFENGESLNAQINCFYDCAKTETCSLY